MVEGQDGLNWARWQKIARVAEESGYVGLYRSDHFTNPVGPYRDSLECWASLAWLASHTSRIEFGPLVSPMSYHHPATLVRWAAAISDLSGGRLRFGVGAGWQEREHANYGFHLGSVPERMARFRESVQIMAHLLRREEPLNFEGKYYTLKDAVLLPRPGRRVPLVIGGSGKQVTMPLIVRYGDEWNCGPRTPEAFAETNAYLESMLDKAGRPRAAVRRTMMLFVRYGRTQNELDRRLADQPVSESMRAGTFVGTGSKLRDYLARLEEAGVQRVMLNWRDSYDDVEGMADMARAAR